MNPAISISPVKRFLNMLKVDKREIMSVYVYALFNGVITLSLPLGIQAIINLISGGQVSTSWFILVIFVIAGVIASGVMQIMQLTITENIQQKIFTRSAFEFAYRIPRMKMESIKNAYIPELANRFFDTLSVQKGLSKILIDFSSASLQVVFGLILLSLYHPFFIMFGLLLVVIVYLIFRFTSPKGLRTSIIESKNKYMVAHWLEELARAMETFKLAGQSPLPLSKTDDVVEGYLTSRKAHFKTLLTQYINLVGFKVFVTAGLLLIGGLLVINQQMNIGQFVAAEIIIILVLNSVEKLILSMETIYDVLTSIEKIGNVTDIPLDSDSGTTADTSDEPGLSINITNLGYRFSYLKEETIKNVNITIGSGEKICLSGYNGSGKSLLLHVISGLYDEYSGSISCQGVALTSWCKADFHKLIGDNLTRGDIFNATLFENISLGKPEITMSRVQQVAEIVGLKDFVDAIPQGYHTTLLSEGRNLPQSIILRIMLARSIAGNFKMILLENDFNQLNEKDKTSFLDYLLSQNWTVIAVSNDPLVADKFDRTIVMEKGEIIAKGTVSSMTTYPWYSNIFSKK
ncbi:ATP-binding cassette domain-containing protein [uncultured Roseivirga sp.]|uniref:peptidase domain-containing ABC transporter n=1 Tax=uncultured Roseivirga sp. TaxID=543088 RepID=UPI0030DD5B7A|tara:strand:- start:68003 stop:69724 length:1722 start_codon:yes stop_codon:yes gene_type:complete